MGRGAAGERVRVFPRERGRWEGGDAVGFAALGACHEAGAGCAQGEPLRATTLAVTALCLTPPTKEWVLRSFLFFVPVVAHSRAYSQVQRVRLTREKDMLSARCEVWAAGIECSRRWPVGVLYASVTGGRTHGSYRDERYG